MPGLVALVLVAVQVTSTQATGVDRVIRSRMGIYRACYQKELARTPDLHGLMQVVLEIAPTTGKVVRAEARGVSGEVSSCVSRNILPLTFPVGAAGTYKFTITFFQPVAGP